MRLSIVAIASVLFKSAAAATAPTDPNVADERKLCSCAPREFNLQLKLNQDCRTNTLEGSDGIGLALCSSGSQDNRRRNMRGLRRQLDRDEPSIVFERSRGESEVTELNQLRQLSEEMEIISIQFLEFDTSQDLNVLNQDDRYNGVPLKNGDVVMFESVSLNLDPAMGLEKQLEYLPGGVQVTIKGRVVEGGEEKIVSKRVSWSYTNDCQEEPIEAGDSIGWVAMDEIERASSAFCPATATATTTVAATDAPVTTTEAPEICSYCPDGVPNPDLPMDSMYATTCATLKQYADTVLASDYRCPFVKYDEGKCCPPVVPTPAPVTTESSESFFGYLN